jgi:uncharacterized repeat protein (TIGR03803 family)
MTKSRSFESFPFSHSPSQKGSTTGELSFFGRVCFVFAFCALTAIASPSQTFTTLASAGEKDASLNGPLVQGIDGNFYGTSQSGGHGVYGGVGTVFKTTPAGKVTPIYAFSGPDGDNPNAALVLGTDGNFYGTTLEEGSNGDGTVFKITPAGTLTTLYSFSGPDGYFPTVLVQSATDGNFYGITIWGGPSANCTDRPGCGTVFKLTPEGALTTLHSFDGNDGAYPNALVQGTDGNFYGTTFYGGANSLPACTDNESEAACGTVFKITPGGTLTTLHSFDLKDGALPTTLIQASDGDFYGTTAFGGHVACPQDQYGCGTIFKITAGGTLTTLHRFTGADGFNGSGLLQAMDGNFYGTTAKGGANTSGCFDGCGTIFKVTPTGTLSTLYSFCAQTNCPDGSGPQGLLQGTNGIFYGTTPFGGAGALGAVYSLSTGLSAFVDTVPAAGQVGAGIIILGNNLTGTTSVTFNGAAATFTVLSSAEITAVVPTGATSGTVEVTTPKKTLKSSIQFRVTP